MNTVEYRNAMKELYAMWQAGAICRSDVIVQGDILGHAQTFVIPE